MSSACVKREPTQDAQMTITRSNIWYNDGSIVLQVTNTQFRVHWGVLRQHSSWFRDFGNPPDQPIIDGCPILELRETSDVDVEYVLEALYDPHYLGQHVLPLAAVGAMIRLGCQYGFKNLLDSANTTPLFNSRGYPTHITLEYQDFYSRFLMLGRETGMLSALPVVYLHVQQLGIANLVGGLFTEGRTLAPGAPDDIRRCLIGREKLLTKQFQPDYPLGWLIPWPGCCEACASYLHAEYRRYMEERLVDALHVFDTARWHGLLCEHCYKHALKSNAAGRQKMWEELPAIFDLPEWDQLRSNTHNRNYTHAFRNSLCIHLSPVLNKMIATEIQSSPSFETQENFPVESFTATSSSSNGMGWIPTSKLDMEERKRIIVGSAAEYGVFSCVIACVPPLHRYILYRPVNLL
ncbi:hypothetical protein MSAN_01674900 [Mycena sanguinolenta]|uniref:BTB domain-containing protein n=1 Tax=Mycena sanguinolenta TaxID=230812 RepID=A0A8H6Y394_9AGAR|nr:hypothetical protein MSAN_01674900 [Mycena sanguinolenta]